MLVTLFHFSDSMGSLRFNCRSTFRQGIIAGDKAILTHVLFYLLTKLEDLKKRAYLARFLVKIEVSVEVEGDNDIVDLYEQVGAVAHKPAL